MFASSVTHSYFHQHKSLEAYKIMFGEDDTLWGGPNEYGPTAKKVISILLDRIGHRGGR